MNVYRVPYNGTNRVATQLYDFSSDTLNIFIINIFNKIHVCCFIMGIYNIYIYIYIAFFFELHGDIADLIKLTFYVQFFPKRT